MCLSDLQQVQERLGLYTLTDLDTCSSGVVDGFQEHGAGVDLKFSLRCYSPSPGRNCLFHPSPPHGGHILFPTAEPSPPYGCGASRQKALMARQALLAACGSELTDGTELRTLALADLMKASAVGRGASCDDNNSESKSSLACSRSRSRSGSILPADWLVPLEGELQINGGGGALDEFEEQYTLGTARAASGSVSKSFNNASRCVVETQTLSNIAPPQVHRHCPRTLRVCMQACRGCSKDLTQAALTCIDTARSWSTAFGTHSRTMACVRKCL